MCCVLHEISLLKSFLDQLNVNKKNSVKGLSLICLITMLLLCAIYSLEIVRIIEYSDYSPKMFAFVRFLFASGGRSVWEKSVSSVLRPSASGGIQTLGHSFSQYGHAGW